MVSLFLTAAMCLFSHTSHTQVDAGVYSKTAARWAEILAERTDKGSTTLIKKLQIRDKLHKNGSRDYIVWIPEGAGSNCKTDEQTIGIVWFHGHTGFSERTFRERILKQFAPHMHKNFFVVVPEMPWSWNTSTRTRRNGRIWQKPGEFIEFIGRVREDVAQMGINKIDWRIVGHSAGGSTIKTIGQTGDLCKLNPSRIVWSDSSYGYWMETANSGCLQNYRTDAYVTHWASKTNVAALRFAKTKQGRNTTVHKSKLPHLKIGDNIVKLSGILE